MEKKEVITTDDVKKKLEASFQGWAVALVNGTDFEITKKFVQGPYTVSHLIKVDLKEHQYEISFPTIQGVENQLLPIESMLNWLQEEKIILSLVENTNRTLDAENEKIKVFRKIYLDKQLLINKTDFSIDELKFIIGWNK